jgi:hypothetical protein
MKEVEMIRLTSRAQEVSKRFAEFEACIQLTDFANPDNIDDLGRDFKITLANLGITDSNIDTIFSLIKKQLNMIADKDAEWLQSALFKKEGDK